MKALITGASSGIGKDIAFSLAKREYDLVLIARDEQKLDKCIDEIQKEFSINIKKMIIDVSDLENCKIIHKEVPNVDLLVNNAGFGDCGNFTKTSLEKDLKMINTNISAYHILTKLYLTDMKKMGSGHVLNVASIAGFMSGPLMATYYATKAYVVSLSESIREELNKEKSNVKISILCPGPVKTNFTNVANVKFNIKEANSKDIAEYAVKKLEKGKFYIIPKLSIKVAKIGAKFAPRVLVGKVSYMIQKRKFGKDK